MAIYLIGDVQGCYDELMALLKRIKFNKHQDKLLFTGDLINRGPQSLNVVRFVKSLGRRAVTVLGNHDLHYLAVSCGVKPLGQHDTFSSLLTAKDNKSLFHWMRKRPLLYLNKKWGILLVHAGILPHWDLISAQRYTKEVEQMLRGKRKNYLFLLKQMYGDHPAVWSPHHPKMDRMRFVMNCLTRMRYITSSGILNLSEKGKGKSLSGHQPWFTGPLVLHKKNPGLRIFFGHWAALNGRTNRSNVIGLDTGCCWGNRLTAVRLSDLKVFNIKCRHTSGEVKR